ncbi:uncharacterized protein Z520_02174 [Fonsecaea multimorphosa CBS 102226]|uniref:NAD(P)-binding protein n=1 Tax=Fonsecaea multimorphosa CBS 102226 TaxID=1442371 RepID=A0A0D2HJG6_9EURO|nr:uncharacterized protein Z520_02174 [Fonsecaea multimorphosa CBS 102226]KIY02036.1 hypothetical protein Z520_02174 [Fonsecaea multimorphosa CBS 102226]OAL29236.1 hypothetical protein AYO22_02130 [Fonsecaea multimorphosa]
MDKYIYNVCAVIGASTIGYIGLQLASALRFHLHTSKLQRYHHGTEPWVLITGASDGIGLAFVHAFASRGFNVILHGRNEAKLNKIISEQMKTQHQTTKFRTLVLDAGTPADAEFDETVLAAVKDLNLTVVVHNVAGSGAPQVDMKLFSEMSREVCDGWIDVNVRFTTHLTRLLLPVLARHQPSLMLFMSSAVTEITAPSVSLYTGAKNYIEGFAKCLKMEVAQLAGNDIEIMSFTTGTVATASSGRSEKDISFTMPSTTTFVKAALDKVGVGAPSTKVTPYFPHWLQFGFMKMLPAWARDQMLLRMLKQVQDAVAKRE